MAAQITVDLPAFGPPALRDNEATFDDNAEDTMAKLGPFRDGLMLMRDQVNVVTAEVSAKAAAAEASATAAGQAALVAGAVAWNAATSYAFPTCAVDPDTALTYRKRTAASVSATKPSQDPANWKNVSATAPTAAVLADSGASGTPIQWDAGAVQVATVILGGNRTIALPTSLPIGTLILHVKQDATGGRTFGFGVGYNFVEGVAPQPATQANRRTVFSVVSDGVELYGSYLPGFLK